MRALELLHINWLRLALGTTLVLTATGQPGRALDKPTGAPLVLSAIETEQAVPLAVLAPDGKTASCVLVRLHWNPKADVGPNDDATSFTLDLAPDNPSASIFTAQLWNASLASALAWQSPWQGARWKLLDVPTTDGTGIDAALAVGMIATSARRPYPKETVVMASLNPDGSLGPVSHLVERMDAAASAGMSRVIIPSVQRFDTDASGQVLNMVRHAGDLHLECVPVDTLVEATEETMNDPLPDSTLDSSTPKYSNDVATYIDDFAHREQTEVTSGLQFAPKEEDLAKLPARTAAIWKSIYADNEAGEQAYRAGQVYVAYRLFERANGRMHGVNALTGQNRVNFDVKATLADSDALRQQLHNLMNPPSIDQGELESAVLVAEMADWAYDINASLEGAQLVTKQAFSQRSDATEAEKDRAREALLFAIAEGKYLVAKADFFKGLLPHIGANNQMPVDANAAQLLPQLVPAQLAIAEIFTNGIRQRANDLRDGLLFDPRLVAYVDVLRESKAAWDARQRKKEQESAAASASPGAATASANTTTVGFDPGNTYTPPHSVLVPSEPAKKLSDAASCLIWLNHACEIATLDEKYLRLNGTVDPTTHEWHLKDRAKLDALLQSAETGARHGIAFAEKTGIDPSVLGMIYEKATHQRIQGDDGAALDALRNYWRCALLGNMCWQLAHTHKAQPVDLAATTDKDDNGKTAKKDDKSAKNADDKEKASTAKQDEKDQTSDATRTADKTPPVPKATVAENPAPATAPRALPATDDSATNSTAQPAPPPVPSPPAAVAANTNDDQNVPVAPVAKPVDLTGGDANGSIPPPSANNTTNTPPVIGPSPPADKPDNADGHASAFP